MDESWKEDELPDIRRIQDLRKAKRMKREEAEKFARIMTESFEDYFGEDFVDEDIDD